MNHSPFNAPSLEAVGALLPAFEFKSLIASNDLGAVYLATQRSLERDVAIKFLSPDLSADPVFQQQFENTAHSMAKLNHPNLIGVYDSGNVAGMLYLTMEFVPGKSLGHSTKGHAIDCKQALLLVDGICDGLIHAHDHRIVHGDLNPTNILLNQKAEPKIGNFGFSHPADPAAAARETSRFIAPEVLAQPGPATSQADVFSVAAILYELLTGQHQGPDAAPPSGFSDCGPKIDELWRHATEADPNRRMTDVRSLQAALKETRTASLRAPLTAAAPAAAPAVRAARPARPAAITPATDPSTPPPTPPPTTATPTSPPVIKIGFNWKLVRNLCIIAGLLYAISFAWDKLKATRAQRDRENRETLAEAAAQKTKDQEAARQRALDRAKTANPTAPSGGVTPPKPPPVKKIETPGESLERLRKDLASGYRNEMPVGSIRKGEQDYFLVSQDMSWPEAAWFAEKHGGHLAIPSTTADLSWLIENLAADQPIWIGAARNGRNTWALADGSSWKPRKQPAGIGQYLAADKHGFLRAENATTRIPFIIQWHRDGSNPGALASLLASTRSSLTRSNPAFPPGTRAYGVRNYLFVARPIPWREAVDLAANAGGNLMVPGQIAETVNLSEMVNELTADHRIWLGGFLKGDQWVWITGEPWKAAKWADDATTTNPDSGLVIRPGKGWDAQNLAEPASGFIIEWSADANSSSAPQVETVAPAGDTSGLTAKARQLITEADATRTKNLADNVAKISLDLTVYMRSLPKSHQESWGPHVQALRLSIKNNRLPSSIPSTSGISLSEKMAALVQYHSEKQDKIDREFAETTEKLRAAFTAKLREAQNQEQQAGQTKLAQSIGETIEQASELGPWLRSFGVELQPENPIAGAQP